MQTQGVFCYRWTFPQLPWGTVKNPTFIQTKHGYRTYYFQCFWSELRSSSNRLLTSGWWQFSRKPVRTSNNSVAWLAINLEPQNYVADWIMSFTWGLVVGTASPIPYFYSVFFITVLIHRTTRDFERYANTVFW